MLDRFKDLVVAGSSLEGLKEVISPGAAIDKAHEMLREFNETVPTLKAIGLSVSDVSFKMGIPPEIAATLVGSVSALDGVAIKDAKGRYRDNRVVTLILEALILASTFKSQLSGLGFAGVKVDVRLGLFPSVQVGLLSAAAASRA